MRALAANVPDPRACGISTDRRLVGRAREIKSNTLKRLGVFSLAR